MPRLAPPSLKLTQSEREQLIEIVNRHSTPQQIALRTHIILLADQGHNHQEIVDCLNISRDMARLWRNRWLELKKQQTERARTLKRRRPSWNARNLQFGTNRQNLRPCL